MNDDLETRVKEISFLGYLGKTYSYGVMELVSGVLFFSLGREKFNQTSFQKSKNVMAHEIYEFEKKYPTSSIIGTVMLVPSLVTVVGGTTALIFSPFYALNYGSQVYDYVSNFLK